MPAAFTSFAYFSTSAFMKAPNSSGEPPDGGACGAVRRDHVGRRLDELDEHALAAQRELIVALGVDEADVGRYETRSTGLTLRGGDWVRRPHRARPNLQSWCRTPDGRHPPQRSGAPGCGDVPHACQTTGVSNAPQKPHRASSSQVTRGACVHPAPCAPGCVLCLQSQIRPLTVEGGTHLTGAFYLQVPISSAAGLHIHL